MDYKISTAVAVVINNKNQVLLGRCVSDDQRNGLLCFPGGGIESKEDVFTAALRELREETNVIGSLSRMTFVIHQEVPFIGFVLLRDTGDNTDIVWNDEYDPKNAGGWYDLNKLPSDEILNSNLDVLKTMRLTSKPVYYNKNNESMSTLKELIESGESVKNILNLKEAKSLTENFPGKGEIVQAKDLNHDMLSYFSRMNVKLLIDTKTKKGIKGSVGKMFTDFVFNGDSIDKKDILKVKIE